MALLVASGGTALAARASIVVEAESGRVLQASSINLRSFPASTTKMMTLYLAFEALKGGRLSLGEMLPVSARASGQSGQSLGLVKGQKIAVRDAILGSIVESANDAAVVLAERLGGSEDAFAQLMTEKARSLGMTRTTFRNATGLNHPEHATTARDLALLALALLHDFPKEYAYFATRSLTVGKARFTTVNGFLVNYRGADGIKTGFTCAAGYNLVASAVHDGRRLVAVVLGETTKGGRGAVVARVLDAGFRQPRASEGITLADLDPARTHDVDPPPQGVIAEECAAIVARAGAPNAGNGMDPPAGRIERAAALSGWGVDVGWGRPGEGEALRAARQVQASNGMSFRRGRISAVRSGIPGHVFYRPLVVGLDEASATMGCAIIRQNGGYCMVLNPLTLTAAGRRSATMSAGGR